MKNSKLNLSLATLVLAGSFFFASCQRDVKTKDTDTSAASDNAMSEMIFNDVSNIADDASSKQSGDNLGNYKTASNCATITHDTISTPKTITIDFGTTNCMCNDGRYRKGIIEIAYSGHYRDSGSVHAITFNNYFVNNNHIMGSKTVENMGKNASNQSFFNINVNGMIVKSMGDTVTWNAIRTRTWTQGEATQQMADDVYEITGTANGQRANGHTYTMTITQPLVKALDCQWIQAGKMDIQPMGLALRSIDFGNGTCDNDATVTINGNTYNITLN